MIPQYLAQRRMQQVGRGMIVLCQSSPALIHHGAQGQGGAGPPLAGLAARYSQDEAVAFIKQPGPRMPKLFPGTLQEKDVIDVAAYVRSLPGK